MYYWKEPPPAGDASPAARAARWETNFSSFLNETEQKHERVVQLMSGACQALDEISKAIKEVGPSKRANALEDAYTFAVLQERRETRELMEELMVGLNTIGDVKEFLAQRPELKEFVDKAIAGDDIRGTLKAAE